jgi:serine/threonine protein kinase
MGSAYYMVPKVLKRKSSPKFDAWNIGVITYILLCGMCPFEEKIEIGFFNDVGERVKKNKLFKLCHPHTCLCSIEGCLKGCPREEIITFHLKLRTFNLV